MKTVIITGANGNLGSAVTQTFLSAGFMVIATVTNEAAKSSFANHPQLEVNIVDLTSEADTNAFIAATIQKHSQVDAALLLVGGFAMGDIAATTGADLKKMYALNFETAYYTTRPLFAHMKKNGSGRIVFVGARPALQPADGKDMLAYALSKSLLFELAACLNEEAKGTNVTATVVVPSTLDTPLNRQSMPDANPANWVQPQDVAGIMEFICSGEAVALREPVYKIYNNA